MMRKPQKNRCVFFILMTLLGGGEGHAQDAMSRSANAVISRLAPQLSGRLELKVDPTGVQDRFVISGTTNQIQVKGSSISAALYGANWYLKYVAKMQITPNGSQLATTDLPSVTTPITMTAQYPVRYALNENTDGYTSPYWPWSRWEHEIDIYALSGINAMLVERGTDMVLYRTLQKFGYSESEIRHWLTEPAHQNWQLMGNMCCFDEPISKELLSKRLKSAQKIVARLRELGITPVLPGFYGIVPDDFGHRNAGAHVIAQGTWNGFTRPAWLDPGNPVFSRVAEEFFRTQKELFGTSTLYDMEAFQEGGTTGGVSMQVAGPAIQNAMLKARKDASWLMMNWFDSPSPELLKYLDRSHILIVDLEQNTRAKLDRKADYQGAPFLYGGLWDFGGRMTLGGQAHDIVTQIPQMAKINPGLRGTAIFPEGMDNNPYLFDLFTEMAWRDRTPDLESWTADYVTRRYGMADQHALNAWNILYRTAYGVRADPSVDFDQSSSAIESLFDAQPSFSADQASTAGPQKVRYDPALFRTSLSELLQVSPRIRTLPTYQYDLVDVARQCLSNESRRLLPLLKTAYDQKNLDRFVMLSNHWLQLMEIQDRLLNTNAFFMVGPWLAWPQAWAASQGEAQQLNYDARSILTNWGDRTASQQGGLHDYANKEWAGITHDYYRKRWQLFFDTHITALKNGQDPAPIDWYMIGEQWNHETNSYSTTPSGNAWDIASEINREIGG